MDKWHTKKCAEWNKKNRSSYFQTNYLSAKLAFFAVDEVHSDELVSSRQKTVKTRFQAALPAAVLQNEASSRSRGNELGDDEYEAY